MEAARRREERGEKCFAPFPVSSDGVAMAGTDSENFGGLGSAEERHRV